jgi:hypothetical protein
MEAVLALLAVEHWGLLRPPRSSLTLDLKYPWFGPAENSDRSSGVEQSSSMLYAGGMIQSALSSNHVTFG